jgi:hypothetical protein
MSTVSSRFARLIFAVLLGSGSAIAQGPASGPSLGPAQNSGHSTDQDGTRAFKHDFAKPSTLAIVTLREGHNCPIYMRAQQRSGEDLLRTSQSGGTPEVKPVGPTQRIHLILGNMANSANITQVEVTVQGTSGKNRTVQTMLTPDGVSDVAKAFNLPVNIGKDEGASTNLTLHGFTSVQSINLESVTYADGSTWNPSATRTCSIAPDPLVLVSGR